MKELLSPAVQERFAPIHAHPELYTPNLSVVGELGKRSLVMLISPCAGGKGYCIHKIVTKDPRYKQSRSFTSRDGRSDDTPETIRRIDWTDEDITAFCEMIEQGNFVNFIFHPKTDEIYGTTLADHPGEYNLLPTLTKGVKDLEVLPFRHTATIGLATEPDQWQPWFDKREFKNSADRTARIGEGVTSIEWLLEHPEVSIVKNMPGSDATASIRRIVETGLIERDETTAMALLKHIKSLT